MAQTLETIKGGGGSIKVGTTGTIESLMTMELKSMKNISQTPNSSKRKPQMLPVSVPCGVTTSKRSQPGRSSSNEASTSHGIISITHKSPVRERNLKTKNNIKKNSHRIPMLGSDSSAQDGTPKREKTDKKASHIVEIVDIKCGNSEKGWSSPITNQLKKLSFSKLSNTIG